MNTRFFPVATRSLAWVAAIGIAFCGQAAAVELNTTPSGDAVIAPLWNTAGGHATLVTLFNATEFEPGEYGPADDYTVPFASATTLRLFNANGEEQLSAVAYLEAGKQFRFALASDGDGLARLQFNDSVCLLSGSQGSLQSRVSPIAVAADHGYLVAISNGVVTDLQIRANIANNDCSALQSRWNAGDWSQDPSLGLQSGGRIDLQASMINVDKGTLYQIPSTGLVQFSDIVQHQPPGSGLPNLGTAHDAGTDAGMTTAHRCINGACTTQEFESPLYAMWFALSTPSLVADYGIDPNLGARTEVILTSPLAQLLSAVEAESNSDYFHVVSARLSNQSGIEVGQIGNLGVACPALPPPGGCPFGFPVEAVSSLVIWRADELTDESVVNDLSGIPPLDQPSLSGNAFQLQYGNGDPEDRLNGRIRILTHAVAQSSGADAVIGVALQQVVNAQLVDGDGGPVRANYGKALPMRRVAD